MKLWIKILTLSLLALIGRLEPSPSHHYLDNKR